MARRIGGDVDKQQPGRGGDDGIAAIEEQDVARAITRRGNAVNERDRSLPAVSRHDAKALARDDVA